MDGHLEGWFAEVITAGSHKPQLSTLKLAQRRATLPMLRGPAGSTSTTTTLFTALMSTEDAQKGMLVETGNGEGSREVVQVGE
jgi:hypothetical protein